MADSNVSPSDSPSPGAASIGTGNDRNSTAPSVPPRARVPSLGLYASKYGTKTLSEPLSAAQSQEKPSSSLESSSLDLPASPSSRSQTEPKTSHHPGSAIPGGVPSDSPIESRRSHRRTASGSTKCGQLSQFSQRLSASKDRASKRVRVVSASLRNAKSTTPIKTKAFSLPASWHMNPISRKHTNSSSGSGRLKSDVVVATVDETAAKSDGSGNAPAVLSNGTPTPPATRELEGKKERIRRFSESTLNKLRVSKSCSLVSVQRRARRSYNTLKNGIPVVLLVVYSIASAWALLAVERNSPASLYPGQTNATCIGTDFWKALFYVNTLYTTIGYGNVYACTMWSRILSVVIAILGIPFVFIVLNSAGRLLGTVMNKICIISLATWQFVDRKRRGKPTPGLWDRMRVRLEEDEPIHVPIYLGIVLTVLWVMVCATYFSVTERWDYLSSLYFSLISLMTIGLGDLAPEQYGLGIVTFCAILVGLSLVSMSIKVVQAHIEHLFNQMKIDIMTEDAVAKPKSSGELESDGERTLSTQPRNQRYLHALLSERQLQVLDRMVEKKTRLRMRGIQATPPTESRGTNPVMADFFTDNKGVNTILVASTDKRCQTETIDGLPPLDLLAPRTQDRPDPTQTPVVAKADTHITLMVPASGSTRLELPSSRKLETLGQGALNLMKRTVSVSFKDLSKTDNLDSGSAGKNGAPGPRNKHEMLMKVKKSIKDGHDAMKKDPHYAQGADFVATVRKSMREKGKESAKKLKPCVERTKSSGALAPPDANPTVQPSGSSEPSEMPV